MPDIDPARASREEARRIEKEKQRPALIAAANAPAPAPEVAQPEIAPVVEDGVSSDG
jgi:hypothetical protein